MFVLLFILGAALCNGYEIEHLNYGDKIKIRLPFRTHTLMFFREGDSNGTILWRRYNTADTESRGYRSGMYYIIEKSTQRDSGRYESTAQNGGYMSEKSISVNANTKTIHLTADEEFRFDFNLEQDSCNIKFKPLDYYEWIDVVYRGRKSMNTYYGCEMLKIFPPCEIFYQEVVQSCQGHFEVRDNYDNLAWQLELNVAYFDAQAIILPAVIPGVIVACCCCLRRCFCKKSSKKDKPSEDEPVLLTRTEQPETLYPAQPNPSTGPLIHNPPANAPPAYSEASAPTVPPSYASTVPPSYASTVPPSYASTVPPSYASTVPPSYASTVPPSYASTVPPSYDPTVPPSSAPTVPPSSAPTVPPSSAPTVPPSSAPTVPPSSAPTVPVSYNPTAPPSFAPTVSVSFNPTLPSSSELDPRFELKSFTLSSYSPLSSETEGGVYHSDKLNF